jgi:hypothetical protein
MERRTGTVLLGGDGWEYEAGGARGATEDSGDEDEESSGDEDDEAGCEESGFMCKPRDDEDEAAALDEIEAEEGGAEESESDSSLTDPASCEITGVDCKLPDKEDLDASVGSSLFVWHGGVGDRACDMRQHRSGWRRRVRRGLCPPTIRN